MNEIPISQLEQQLNQLKVTYEQYFMGIERQEPIDLRKKIRRAIVDAAETPTNKTAERFKAQSLKARLTTFENYWNRINKQIEDGTYKRHRFKTELHEQMQQEARGGTAHVDLGESAAPASSGFDSVIHQYQSIQKQSGQSPVEAAKLNALLQKQEAQLKQKLGVSRVEFRVAIENGKPKLKARPIK